MSTEELASAFFEADDCCCCCCDAPGPVEFRLLRLLLLRVDDGSFEDTPFTFGRLLAPLFSAAAFLPAAAVRLERCDADDCTSITLSFRSTLLLVRRRSASRLLRERVIVSRSPASDSDVSDDSDEDEDDEADDDDEEEEEEPDEGEDDRGRFEREIVRDRPPRRALPFAVRPDGLDVVVVVAGSWCVAALFPLLPSVVVLSSRPPPSRFRAPEMPESPRAVPSRAALCTSGVSRLDVDVLWLGFESPSESELRSLASGRSVTDSPLWQRARLTVPPPLPAVATDALLARRCRRRRRPVEDGLSSFPPSRSESDEDSQEED